MRELQYPIGEFETPDVVTPEQIRGWIDEIEALPGRLRETVDRLDTDRLDVPYRPGGWTSRQVVHHLADSHLNSLVRFKWALTEERPMIKAYHEDRWAELCDYREPIECSLAFLQALHARWATLLRGLTEPQWDREFVHPDLGPVPLRVNVGIYAWHGRHHLAHITALMKREGWS